MNEPGTAVCQCGTELAPELLACPMCHRLVHARRLAELVRDAGDLESSGEIRAALSNLREALNLLPPATKQHATLHQRASALSDRIDAGEAPASEAAQSSRDATFQTESEKKANPLVKIGVGVGGLGLLFWKFKFVLTFLVTKAKLLLLGLGKTTTLFSMLLSLGLYWTLWGWRFALGIVLSIYVHEMGHVAAMRRFGIPASAPMFVPGLGAFVRMDAYPQTAREDARIGLAGPIWGLGAATLVAAAHLATGIPMLAAIASVGAWINLFNLVPVWQLDGSRAFRAFSKPGRWAALGVVAVCGVATQEGMFILIGLGALMQVFSSSAPATTDRRTILEFSFLLAALGALTMLPVAVSPS